MPPQCLYCALCGARMPHPLASGGVVGNRYQVARTLTVRGLHLQTFLAQDRQTNQHVVLKELRDDLRVTPESRQEFQEELQTLATLAVPGVPRARGMVAHEGRQFLILEFIQGKTLRGLLQKQQRLSVDQGLQVLKGLLGVLDGLHNQFPPLLHLDVTPDNVHLAGWDKTFLLDGAYLRQLGNPFPHRAPLYSPEYAAPEVVRGQAVPASDLYALGVTILEAVSGVPAAGLFNTGSNRHVWEPLPHPGLQAALTRMLEPAVNGRAATAAEVLQALEGAQPPQPGFQQPAPGFPPAQPGFQQPAPGYPPQPAQAWGQPAATPQVQQPSAQPQGWPQQPPQVSQAPPQLTRPAQPPPAPPPPPEPEPAPEPPRREVPTEIPTSIEDVSTEEGLEALMALYEAQNS